MFRNIIYDVEQHIIKKYQVITRNIVDTTNLCTVIFIECQDSRKTLDLITTTHYHWQVKTLSDKSSTNRK